MQEALPQEITHAPPPGHDFGPYGRWLLYASKVLAIIGGLIFVALVIMSIISIVGRKVASAPIPGDVELLQMCAAFASACFFAYCHLTHSDVKVDFFTTKLSANTNAKLDVIGSLLVALFGALIAWRSTAGAMQLRDDGETSMILNLPVWIAQMLMTPGFVLLALAGLYMAWHNLTVNANKSANNTQVQA